MLRVAQQGDFWSGDKFELNMTFESLRDYQWDRLIKAIWSYAKIHGPYEERYSPGQPEPPKTEAKKAEPTATYTEFGIFEIAPDVKVGLEVLVTRSLFECVSILIPVKMFENFNTAPESADYQALVQAFYEMALEMYQMTTFSIAAIGINRGCQLLLEMVTDQAVRDVFVKQGDFLARDDALGALRLQPRLYKEVKPTLRWAPATHK